MLSSFPKGYAGVRLSEKGRILGRQNQPSSTRIETVNR